MRQEEKICLCHMQECQDSSCFLNLRRNVVEIILVQEKTAETEKFGFGGLRLCLSSILVS
jgi:hypothetical protein